MGSLAHFNLAGVRALHGLRGIFLGQLHALGDLQLGLGRVMHEQVERLVRPLRLEGVLLCIRGFVYGSARVDRIQAGRRATTD